MMKLMIPAVRRPGMTHDELRQYLVQVHGPLVLGVPDVVADIRHYHYDFPVPGATDPAFGHPLAGHVDVLTQIWFDDRDGMMRNISSAGYRNTVRPDEANFADNGRVVPHLTIERGAAGTRTTGFKVFYFRRRRPELTRDEFQARWLDRFSAALASHPRLRELAPGYVQNHCLPEAQHRDGADTRYFDLIDEFFVERPDSLRGLASDPQFSARVRELEADLLDTSRTLAFVSETRQMLA